MTKSTRRRLTVIAVAVVTMSAAPHVAAAREGQGATALDETHEALRANSTIDGLDVTTLLDKLPKAPASARQRKDCEGLVIVPATDGGKEAAAQGWIVTGEAKIGSDGDTVVSFAGAVHPVDNDYCTVAQGNVGIFRDGQLKAIAYASPSSKLSIGAVTALEGSGARVWSGAVLSAPIADIADTDGGYLLELRAVADQETLCGGTVTVPNIYNMKIDEARAALIAKGWSPAPHDDTASPRLGQEAKLVKRGFIETDSCSEGLDFCVFSYRSGTSSLAVTTVGDDPAPPVIHYNAQCAAGPKGVAQ